jgi:hypothetical protein
MVLLVTLLVAATAKPQAAGEKPPAAEDRAIAYLSREVPRWSVENKCYSCHNNGDAARALYLATGLKREVPANALADTTAWLVQPDRWDRNGGEGPFSDKKLARLQFAATLAAALRVGAVKDAKPLRCAAEQVARDQDKDGSWTVDSGGVGSPATHGAVLATVLARQTLQQADPQQHAQSLAAADRWLSRKEVKTVVEAGALLQWAEAANVRPEWFDLIRKGQAPNGGWGPYANSSPEPFDTAIVLLGLIRHLDRPEVKEMVQRGRAYLVATQKENGNWPETTRPAGAESYAQRLSTTGWALRALLETSHPRPALPRQGGGSKFPPPCGGGLGWGFFQCDPASRKMEMTAIDLMP